MTREEATALLKSRVDLIKSNYPEIDDYCEALEMGIEALEQEPCEDCISRTDSLRVAKNEYLRGWHDALCKALGETHSIHCEEGNFRVIQEETITGLGLSMDCAVGKDVESYMSTIPPVTPQPQVGYWIEVIDEIDSLGNRTWHHKCSICGNEDSGWGNYKYCPDCGTKMQEVGK